MTGNRWRKNRRARLAKAQDGRCHWCRCVMGPVHVGGLRTRPPEDSVTLDHLVTKWEKPTRRPKEGDCVAACWACNQRRALEENATKDGADKLKSIAYRSWDKTWDISDRDNFFGSDIRRARKGMAVWYAKVHAMLTEGIIIFDGQ